MLLCVQKWSDAQMQKGKGRRKVTQAGAHKLNFKQEWYDPVKKKKNKKLIVLTDIYRRISLWYVE